MRIFLDCTHTANNTYKNTGIHRVVRELISELGKLIADSSELEIIPVRFDGYTIDRVENLDRQINNDDAARSSYFDNIIIRKIAKIPLKINNKLFTYLSILSSLMNFSLFNRSIEFEGVRFSQNDVYMIIDANWDLPKSYYYFLASLKRDRVKIGIICYDLIPLKFPKYCSDRFYRQFSNFYSSYSQLFDKILCISNNSARDYLEAQVQGSIATNQNSEITSFRLGSNFQNPESTNGSEANLDLDPFPILNDKYILVVGSLTPHKNIQAIITAFNLLLAGAYDDIHLVFAGNRGWDLATDRLIENQMTYGEKIHILGSVTDARLNILYRNCYCLVQASFYEGFGLPVVEALQHGKPVIASTGGSLPEVGGDFCLYFNPTEPVELYQALSTILDSELEYDRWVNRIKNEYKSISWQESAAQFLDCIRN